MSCDHYYEYTVAEFWLCAHCQLVSTVKPADGECAPITPQKNKAAVQLGKMGGSKKSPAKTAAARANARKPRQSKRTLFARFWAHPWAGTTDKAPDELVGACIESVTGGQYLVTEARPGFARLQSRHNETYFFWVPLKTLKDDYREIK